MEKKFQAAFEILKFVIYVFCLLPLCLQAQEERSDQLFYKQKPYPIYPEVCKQIPDIPSPYLTETGKEFVIVLNNNRAYSLLPVTVENGTPLHYSKRVSITYGKDQQLWIATPDFPELGKTGLHSESHLLSKEMITGIPVDVINCIARPRAFSWAGFIAEDEDIISVLIGDNRLVKKLGFTHAQMAKPLFHVWNIILKEIEVYQWKNFPIDQYFFYNGNKIKLQAEGTKGWQISIFQDEVQGTFGINIQRKLSAEEKVFLKQKYSHLSEVQMIELKEKLSGIHFGEMVPYYIMRYGFYEGHTAYRADPIAIASVFGLKSLEELESMFPGNLFEVLTQHHDFNN